MKIPSTIPGLRHTAPLTNKNTQRIQSHKPKDEKTLPGKSVNHLPSIKRSRGNLNNSRHVQARHQTSSGPENPSQTEDESDVSEERSHQSASRNALEMIKNNYGSLPDAEPYKQTRGDQLGSALAKLGRGAAFILKAPKKIWWDETHPVENSNENLNRADQLKQRLKPHWTDDTVADISVLSNKSQWSLPKFFSQPFKYISKRTENWFAFQAAESVFKKSVRVLGAIIIMPPLAALNLAGALIYAAIRLTLYHPPRILTLTIKHLVLDPDRGNYFYNNISNARNYIAESIGYGKNYTAKHFLPRPKWTKNFKTYQAEINLSNTQNISEINKNISIPSPSDKQLFEHTTASIRQDMKHTLDTIINITKSRRHKLFYDHGTFTGWSSRIRSGLGLRIAKYPRPYPPASSQNDQPLSDRNYLTTLIKSCETLLADDSDPELISKLQELKNLRVFLSTSANGPYVAGKPGFWGTLRTMFGAQRGPIGTLIWGTPNPLGAMAAQLMNDQHTLLKISQTITKAETEAETDDGPDRDALKISIQRICEDRNNSLIQHSRKTGYPDQESAYRMFQAFDRFQIALSHTNSKLRWAMSNVGLQNISDLEAVARDLSEGEELELPNSWARGMGAIVHYLGPSLPPSLAYTGATIGLGAAHEYKYRLSIRKESDGAFTFTLSRKYSLLRKALASGWLGVFGPLFFGETSAGLQAGSQWGHDDQVSFSFTQEALLGDGQEQGALQKLASREITPQEFFQSASPGLSVHTRIIENDYSANIAQSAAVITNFNDARSGNTGFQTNGYIYAETNLEYQRTIGTRKSRTYNSAQPARQTISVAHKNERTATLQSKINPIMRFRPDMKEDTNGGQHGVGLPIDSKIDFSFKKVYFLRDQLKPTDPLLPKNESYSVERDEEGNVQDISWTLSIERNEAIFQIPLIKKLLGYPLTSADKLALDDNISELAEHEKVALTSRLLDLVGYTNEETRGNIRAKLQEMDARLQQFGDPPPKKILKIRATLRKLWDDHTFLNEKQRKSFAANLAKLSRQIHSLTPYFKNVWGVKANFQELEQDLLTILSDLVNNDHSKIDMRENGVTRSPTVELTLGLQKSLIDEINGRTLHGRKHQQEQPEDFDREDACPVIKKIAVKGELSSTTSANTMLIGIFSSEAGVKVITPEGEQVIHYGRNGTSSLEEIDEDQTVPNIQEQRTETLNASTKDDQETLSGATGQQAKLESELQPENIQPVSEEEQKRPNSPIISLRDLLNSSGL